MNKYIQKYRIILIETTNDKNDDYVKAMNKLPKYRAELDKLSTVIIPAYSNKFSISLYGMDGYIKYRSEKSSIISLLGLSSLVCSCKIISISSSDILLSIRSKFVGKFLIINRSIVPPC